jgi:hypothetical protein
MDAERAQLESNKAYADTTVQKLEAELAAAKHSAQARELQLQTELEARIVSLKQLEADMESTAASTHTVKQRLQVKVSNLFGFEAMVLSENTLGHC